MTRIRIALSLILSFRERLNYFIYPRRQMASR
jgi:hypothetical protein